MNNGGHNVLRALTGGAITAVLFYAACAIIEKVNFGTLGDKIPTMIIAGYFAVASVLDYGFSGGKLLLALLQGLCFLGLVLLLRQVSFGRELPAGGKMRAWFAAGGLLICIGLIIYAIYTFAMLGYSEGVEAMRVAAGEFKGITVYLFLVPAALGYLLLLCRQAAGGLAALLFSSTLFLLMLFVYIAPVTNGAVEMYPFFSRFVIGAIALLYPIVMLLAARKTCCKKE